MRALKWDKVDLKNEAALIHRAWKDNITTELGLPKWNKTRDIPLPQSLTDLLRKRFEKIGRDQDTWVFSDLDGSPFGPTWWRKNFYEALTRMGIVKKEVVREYDQIKQDGTKSHRKVYRYKSLNEYTLIPHSLRHSLNTHLLAVGADAIKVQAFLGWSSHSAIPILTRVQQGYTHLTTKDLAEIANIIEDLYGHGTNH
ncbi:MAG: site-specific integrase [Patescibacteria group bacterium]|nr:site-specific integrase [Patescibacteria group bacterium]